MNKLLYFFFLAIFIFWVISNILMYAGVIPTPPEEQWQPDSYQSI